MSQYLDRKQVIELYEKYHPRLATCVYEFGQELRQLPTITIPVAELDTTEDFAEWVFDTNFKELGNPYGTYKCSACGGHSSDKHSFCPNCGASMISSNSEIEKSKSEIENSNLPERFTATDCSCLNCKNRHSVHCEPQNKKIYGYCGNWERR